MLTLNLFRIFEGDCLSRYQFETYAHAYEAVTDFMVFYNERRMHSSILDLFPKEFYEKHIRDNNKNQRSTALDPFQFFVRLS